MKASISISDLSHADVLDQLFSRVGHFRLDGDRIRWVCDDANDAPSVYAFVFHPTPDESQILYVGKAGRGISERLKGHSGGMHGGSSGGIIAAAQIREWIKDGKEISIWSRMSQLVEVFGKQVAIEDAEESSLLYQLNPCPLWNKLKSNRAKMVSKSAPQ